MGSELDTKKIDPSVGGLVWVRRRNGSWWPGRIMGMHELSGDCLASPKSGTPVKLLGKEDSSLDWYNLEKSKRVKAFRCGEFGESIEKAKASSANTNRKAVKYARRDDAILHALEIESAREASEHHKFNKRIDGTAGTQRNNGARQAENKYSSFKENKNVNREGGKVEANLIQELSQSGLSFEDPNGSNIKARPLLKKRWKTPNDSEDDGTERTKRMRGIEDLVNGVESNRKTLSIHIQTEESVQLDCTSGSEPNIRNSSHDGSHVNSDSRFLSSVKRRPQMSSIFESLKRKNRRRQLTKVLESTTLVSVPIYYDEGASSYPLSFRGKRDGKFSALKSVKQKTDDSFEIGNGSVHCHSDSKNSDLPGVSGMRDDDCSDNLFDVPFVDEEIEAEGFSPVYAPSASKKLHSGQVGSISLWSKEQNKYDATGVAIKHSNSIPMTKKNTSRWKLKRKRNMRSLGKKTSKVLDSGRSVDRDEEADTRHMDGLSIIISNEVHNNTLDESLMQSIGTQISNRRGDLKCLDSIENNMERVENREVLIHSAVVRHSKLKPLSEESVMAKSSTDLRILPISSTSFPWVPSLFDVDLEVKTSNTDQNVPLVSLMSKFSGKSIIGNPLTVEVCDDGSVDILTSNLNYCPTSSTAKLFNLPKESSSDQLHLQPPSKKFAGQSTSKPIPSRKKLPKTKKSGNLSKKTRKLSSLNILPKQKEKKKLPVEKVKSTVMTCVPLKLVFSRLTESLKSPTRTC